MTINILMPALSPTMEEGTLSKWLVKEGDEVTSGDIIAEIETDKATMEVECIDDGTVGKILVAEGTEGVKVNALIAVLLEEDEDPSALDAAIASANTDSGPVLAPEPVTAPVVEAAPTLVTTPTVTSGDRVKASPLAKRMAEQGGINLASVAGSGPNGRVVKRDVEAVLQGGGETTAAPVVSQSVPMASVPIVSGDILPPPLDVPRTDVKLSNMRKIIAKRLTESKQSIPHFYLTIEAEIDKLLTLRADLNARMDDAKISVNDFIIKAVALALKKVPAANVQFGGDTLHMFERADISVAVAIEGGLITPVVKGACGKGLKEISIEVKDLARRAKEGKLMPEEYQGGTFSISNLGMFGIKEFSAVINPPQGAILAIGAGQPRAVIKDGAVSAATVMNMTLSCDHRAIDGSVGAEFLAALKGFISDPLTMLL
jgi:pyruvate dehydrogenase E2 component (dihydrolipoamide acetyltransferase)